MIALNDGFHELHFLPGFFFGSGALKLYSKRVVNSSRKASDATKNARKHLRAVTKGYLDMAAEKEWKESYKSDAFQNILLSSLNNFQNFASSIHMSRTAN